MRVYFVVNPVAGRGRGKLTWERLLARLREGGAREPEWDWGFTDRPGAAVRLAAQAAERSYDRVVAVGGDGTLSEVLNGVMGSPVEFAAVPAGTGNDYCRSTGIPLDPVKALDLAVRGAARPVDVGEMATRAGTRYFLNVAGIGFDAEVARAVGRYPRTLGGTVPYVLGALQTLAWYRPERMSIHADGKSIERRVLLAAVGIGRYYGGGMMITPDALIDDGLFDVCLAGDIGPLGVLRLIPGLYRGLHRYDPRVEFLRCRELTLESSRPTAIQAEGEVVGELPARFRVHASQLPMVLGEDAASGGVATAAAAR